jgi:hypothetical protein
MKIKVPVAALPALGFFPGIPGRLFFFNDERTGIPTGFTPVYLTDAPSGYPVDLDTHADRTADHLQQLYVAHKETIGLHEKGRPLAWRFSADPHP